MGIKAFKHTSGLFRTPEQRHIDKLARRKPTSYRQQLSRTESSFAQKKPEEGWDFMQHEGERFKLMGETYGESGKEHAVKSATRSYNDFQKVYGSSDFMKVRRKGLHEDPERFNKMVKDSEDGTLPNLSDVHDNRRIK